MNESTQILGSGLLSNPAPTASATGGRLAAKAGSARPPIHIPGDALKLKFFI